LKSVNDEPVDTIIKQEDLVIEMKLWYQRYSAALPLNTGNRLLAFDCEGSYQHEQVEWIIVKLQPFNQDTSIDVSDQFLGSANNTYYYSEEEGKLIDQFSLSELISNINDESNRYNLIDQISSYPIEGADIKGKNRFIVEFGTEHATLSDTTTYITIY
jgi:hypothetical protein